MAGTGRACRVQNLEFGLVQRHALMNSAERVGRGEISPDPSSHFEPRNRQRSAGFPAGPLPSELLRADLEVGAPVHGEEENSAPRVIRGRRAIAMSVIWSHQRNNVTRAERRSVTGFALSLTLKPATSRRSGPGKEFPETKVAL